MPSLDIDLDWDNFCNNGYINDNHKQPKNKSKIAFNDFDDHNDSYDDLNEDFDNFNVDEKIKDYTKKNNYIDENNIEDIPKSSEIYISTKTKISYLSRPIDLKKTFWNIPISPYHTPSECIIKKQMKFNSNNEEELLDITERLKHETYWDEYIITRIVNPEGRIKFKDIRKINIGLCKKDILSYRTKKKSAFYNCFVIILRISHDNVFREIHVKVFNTGKLEIPGIQNDNLLDKVLTLLINTLKPIVCDDIHCLSDKTQTVLINSNFHCGFFINREKLYEILKYKYHINSGYDPCSYPGIQCKFYYNKKNKDKLGQQPSENKLSEYNKISFMIFRTGSVLIVGKCDEEILNEVYHFIKKLLIDEYKNISGANCLNVHENSSKKKKIRKKTICIEN
jgi:TATA-box binding protein (TBP) (component of TFIID and TFIIIB)